MPASKPFDLDALEREGTPEPFTFRAGGEKFTVTDMKERDWSDLAETQDEPKSWMRLYLGDDFDRFAGLPHGTVPSWKLEQLVGAINAHFGVGEPGEDNASSGS